MPTGVQGLVDFVGYPVGGTGNPSPRKPHAGFLGFVDFVGYPCGGGIVTKKSGHAPKVGGWSAYYYALLHRQEIQEHARMAGENSLLDRLAVRVIEQAAEYDETLAAQRMRTALAVTLAEV